MRLLHKPLICVVAVGLGGACSGDDGGREAVETVSTVAMAETEEIRSEGHEGDTDDHHLAVGANTPQDGKGRYTLHHGDAGPDVLTLQRRLEELGAPIDADNDFGDDTLHAVLEFQQAEDLTADGVVGAATWAALDDPSNTVTFTEPDVPTEYSTAAPTGTVPPTPAPPSTTGTARTGDASAVGAQTAPGHDPAVSNGQWARAVVTLSDEIATFYDGAGNIVLQAPISSGKDDLTPTGTFHVQSKSERAYAGGGSGVYMNWMTRFNGGIGFHSIPKESDGTDLPTPLGQRPVSHGCIRMADDQAKIVFENLPIGAVVEIHA